MDETFGRAGLMANTTCLSVRAIGTVLPELIDIAIDAWLPVGDVGDPGCDSSDPNKTHFMRKLLKLPKPKGFQKIKFFLFQAVFKSVQKLKTCRGGWNSVAMCTWMTLTSCWYPKCFIC